MSDSSRRQSRRQSKKQSGRLSAKNAKKGDRKKAAGPSKSEGGGEENVSMELTILSIENLVAQSYPQEVFISAFYDNNLIGMSKGFTIENLEPVDVNYAMEIVLNEPTSESLFNLISKPVVVTLSCGRGRIDRYDEKDGSAAVKTRSKSVTGGRKSMTSTGKRQSQSAGKRQSTARRGSVKSESKTPSKSKTATSASAISTVTIGKGTIDLLPLIQGESRIEEDVVMEIPENLQGVDIRPFTSLAIVKIRLIDLNKITAILPPLANIAFFTIESLHNSVFTTSSNRRYYATVPVPLTPVEPKEDREIQLLHFEHGSVEDQVDISFRKKWYSIADSPGRSCLTKYRINEKFDDVKDQDKIGVRFTKLPYSRDPRVNWNAIRRVWFTPEFQKFFKDTIIKYKVWPIEITVSPSGAIEVHERLKMGGQKLTEEMLLVPPPTPVSKPEKTPTKSGRKSTSARKSTSGRKSVARKSSAGKKSTTRKSVAKKAGGRKSVAKEGSRKSTSGRKSVAKQQPKGGLKSGSAKSKTLAASSKSLQKPEVVQRKPADPNIKHFIAYVDLSCLLLPGIKDTRAACQIYSYNQADATKKWGLDESLMGWLVPPSLPGPPQSANISLDTAATSKGKLEHSPASTATSTVRSGLEEGLEEAISKQASAAVEPSEAIPNPIPLMSEDGRPVFIIVEVALLKPLVAKKTENETIKTLENLLKVKKPPSAKEALTKIATTEYENCIMTAAGILNKEYKDYQELKTSFIEPFLQYDEKKLFSHIEHSGALASIHESLKDAITKYAVEVVGPPHQHEKHPTDLLNYISKLYRRLVEDMYKVVNRYDMTFNFIERFDKIDKIGSPTEEDLLFFAAEAREHGLYEKSKYYLLKRLEGKNVRNPDYWVDYASNALRFGDLGAAIEATKEALTLDIRHKEALLIYAILLTITRDFDSAEIFFTAINDFHPLYLEGWIAQYIFYSITEKAEVADVTLILATRTQIDLTPAFEDLKTILLSWDEVPVKTNLFLRGALYFLRYNLNEFAEICMAKELERSKEKSLKHYYYLAVNHHAMNRFEDSNVHLEEALRLDWENLLLWSLIGHNHYRLGNLMDAMSAYDFALNESNDEDDLHLIRLRKGFYYLEDQAFLEAKSSFLKVLEKHHTPQAWLGLGIACYNLDEIEDAELALTESNMLDNTIPTSWAYLAMVNLRKANMDMFDQCISEAKKLGLDDEELLAEVEALREEIACEPPRMFPRWKISQVDGNFRPSIAEKFSPVRHSTTGSKLDGFAISRVATASNVEAGSKKAAAAPTKDVEVDIVPSRELGHFGRASSATPARQSSSRTTIHKECGSRKIN